MTKALSYQYTEAPQNHKSCISHLSALNYNKLVQNSCNLPTSNVRQVRYTCRSLLLPVDFSPVCRTGRSAG